MPRKSMVEEYKTSNSTGTGPRTTGNGYTILKGSILFSYSGKKGEYGTLSCKDDDRHPYDKRNKDTATKLNLPELEKSDRETGGTMLNVTGMNRFYYLRNFHDMRCKYERAVSSGVSEEILPRNCQREKNNYHISSRINATLQI